jgi:hypothetical protein
MVRALISHSVKSQREVGLKDGRGLRLTSKKRITAFIGVIRCKDRHWKDACVLFAFQIANARGDVHWRKFGFRNVDRVRALTRLSLVFSTG